ncbi:MAG: cytochrome d ubiquinol oxidase subunit II [Bryobacterales bacterium]|nr:cytochrome d ubiquinol oxidase subunit II [Bryobacterales bacterium]
METLWFMLVALMLAIYVVLDGFDLGAGALHLFLGRDEEGRKQLLGSILPFWDGNEVWLLAAGGTLYFAFPALYASSFSGFYLPLMIVLWLFILRGISIEFRNHIESPLWKQAWDVVFTASSGLLLVFFGAALGNVVRGVPLDGAGEFFLPLWTDFTPNGPTGILDYYTIAVGVHALCALLLHGALWIGYRTANPRVMPLAARLWWVVAALTALTTALTFAIQPQVARNLESKPWGFVFPAIAIGSLLAIRYSMGKPGRLRPFLASAGYLLGMLTSAAFGIYPYVLPSNENLANGLTIRNTATSVYGLTVGLAWWIPGMMLATGYFVFLYRRFAKAA